MPALSPRETSKRASTAGEQKSLVKLPKQVNDLSDPRTVDTIIEKFQNRKSHCKDH